MKKSIFILYVLYISLQPSLSQELAGSWKGELDVMGQKLPLVFNFQKEGGEWAGTMDSPNQGAKGIKLSKVLFEGILLNLEIAAGGISYEGILTSELIKGKFTQNGMNFPLDLQKLSADAVDEVPKRPQTPIAPFDYDLEETTFENLSAGIKLEGTITKPRGDGPFPAVILISGSGPQDRNQEILGHKPFWVVADYLTSQGIVVFRYDERGVAASEGDFATATSIDFQKDAESALDHLRKFPFVDQTKIGVIGHSEGGMIAWEIGAGDISPNFLVALAAPVVPISDLMVKQTKDIARSSGLSKTFVDQQVSFNASFYELLKMSNSEAEAKSKLTGLIEESLANQELSDETKSQQKEALLKAYEPNISPWLINFLKTKPEIAISKINIPVFAAFGGKDLQVNAAENGNLLNSLFEEKSELLHLKVYPEMNHLFQTAKTGAVSEYSQIEESISEEVLRDIAAFILKR
ncbi:serine aminopeptidase domain-containing protein [Rhodonellum sp.]|uniref:alpha/beta hydrolase n=1 Tax=Rhodonellum sp. TaxID=2231180 RepID=UPI0027251DEA|nr:alpha/beta hydrolase [Rhodonellum sp.]MDO9553900.1 alpha/beta hydrolase [Rhodonellum sp.]